MWKGWHLRDVSPCLGTEGRVTWAKPPASTRLVPGSGQPQDPRLCAGWFVCVQKKTRQVAACPLWNGRHGLRVFGALPPPSRREMATLGRA